MNFRSLFILATALALAGCGVRSQDLGASSVQSPDILGGRAFSAADDNASYGAQSGAPSAALATVALVSLFEGRYRSFCSGTLIANDLVLTAAHCVVAADPAEFYIFAGDILPSDLEPETLTKISGTIVHPEFHPDSSRLNDIAVLKLAHAAPSSRKPVKIADSEMQLRPGLLVVVAGFGITAEAHRQYATGLNFVSILIAGIDGQIFTADQTNGKGACGGDSGGSVFYEGPTETLLIGEVRGPQLTQKDCVHTGEFTNATQFKSFILDGARSLSAAPPSFAQP